MAVEGTRIVVALLGLCIVADIIIGFSAYAAWYEMVKGTDFMFAMSIAYITVSALLHITAIVVIIVYVVLFDSPLYDSSSTATTAGAWSAWISLIAYDITIAIGCGLYLLVDINSDTYEHVSVPPYRAHDGLLSEGHVLAFIVMAAVACVASVTTKLRFFLTSNDAVVENILANLYSYTHEEAPNKKVA